MRKVLQGQQNHAALSRLRQICPFPVLGKTAGLPPEPLWGSEGTGQTPAKRNRV